MNGLMKSTTDRISTKLHRRNRKIQTLFAAVICALVAAFMVLLSPELGVRAAAVGGLLASGGSAVLTIYAKHAHDLDRR